MGLVAVFMIVWFLIALGLRALAKRVMGPVRYSRRLWQELTMLLAFLAGFLLARVLYHAFDRWYLTPLWNERHRAELCPYEPAARVNFSWGVHRPHNKRMQLTAPQD